MCTSGTERETREGTEAEERHAARRCHADNTTQVCGSGKRLLATQVTSRSSERSLLHYQSKVSAGRGLLSLLLEHGLIKRASEQSEQAASPNKQKNKPNGRLFPFLHGSVTAILEPARSTHRVSVKCEQASYCTRLLTCTTLSS